mgnify:CR=1 FL=1
MKYTLSALLLSLLSTHTAWAEDIRVIGEGKSLISQDLSLTRQQAFLAAKLDAVRQALVKINGPQVVADPLFEQKLPAISQQIADELIVHQHSQRDAQNNLVTSVTLQIDDLQLRSLISDQGIAAQTARNYPILIVMDEFFTTPTDQQKPLREFVQYFSDQSTHHQESANQHSQDSVQASAAYRQAAATQQLTSKKALYTDGQSAVGMGVRTASAASMSKAGKASYQEKSSASSNYELDRGEKDVQIYTQVTEYQPQNIGPAKQNYTLQAVLRQTNRYDLAIKDADVFRSKYFKGNLTLDQINDGKVLAGFVDAARQDSSDYLMVGTSIILDLGRNASTGLYACDGLINLKAYATADGTAIAADARSESASGTSPDQCRVNVANKLGDYAIGVTGPAIADYWKRRDLYGQTFIVTLKSLTGNLNDNTKDLFSEALEKIQGVTGKIVEKRSTRNELQLSVPYKGEQSLSRAVGGAMRPYAAFAQAGRQSDGNQLTICLEGTCP